MKKTDIKSPLLLFLAAFIWGVAFVAQSKAKDYSVEPFTFNAVRNVIGGLTLLPCIFFLGKREPKEKKIEENPKTLLIGGILCGTVLCIASNLQQIGIKYTTVGHVHCAGANPGNFPEKKSGHKGLDQRVSGGGWSLSSLHDGEAFPGKRRCPGASLRAGICHPHSGHRSFFAEGGRGKAFLHPVSGLRRVVRHSHVSL